MFSPSPTNHTPVIERNKFVAACEDQLTFLLVAKNRCRPTSSSPAHHATAACYGLLQGWIVSSFQTGILFFVGKGT
jgi:hypothetical protein